MAYQDYVKGYNDGYPIGGVTDEKKLTETILTEAALPNDTKNQQVKDYLWGYWSGFNKGVYNRYCSIPKSQQKKTMITKEDYSIPRNL